jgi:small-conductance mechanosensitive channel
MEKITEEQLKNLQDVIAKINQATATVGQLETQKHGILHQLGEMQKDLTKMQEELEKEYGQVSINIEDGTYKEIENDQSDQKD